MGSSRTIDHNFDDVFEPNGSGVQIAQSAQPDLLSLFLGAGEALGDQLGEQLQRVVLADSFVDIGEDEQAGNAPGGLQVSQCLSPGGGGVAYDCLDAPRTGSATDPHRSHRAHESRSRAPALPASLEN